MRMGKWSNQRVYEPMDQPLCALPFTFHLPSLLLHIIVICSICFLKSAWSQPNTLPIIEIQYRRDGEILNSGSLHADLERKTRVQVGNPVSPLSGSQDHSGDLHDGNLCSGLK